MLGVLTIIIGTLVCGLYLVTSFFNVTDPVTRFDRKRQTVWMWTGKGPIEMAWQSLTPLVRSNAASLYFPSQLHRGLYVEFGPNDEPKITNGIPHIIQIGQPSATAEGTLPAMEYVRRYMEQGPQVLPQLDRYLKHRPEWWVMFNFINSIQDYKEGKDHGLGAP